MVSIQYKSGDNDPYDNAIKPVLNLINEGKSSLRMETISIRYWFNADSESSVNSAIDYAKIDKELLETSTVDADNGLKYFQIRFADDYVIKPNSSTGIIKSRVNYEDWSDHDETDDYSFSNAVNSLSENEKITVYQNNQLIYGVEYQLFVGRYQKPIYADTDRDVIGNGSFSVFPVSSVIGIFHLSEDIQWLIIDVSGREVIKGEGKSIDLSTESGNLFLLKTGSSTIQIIKN